MSRTLFCILAAASAGCGLSAAALAQCDVYRLDVPDFDQRREAAAGIWGLPDNGGKHCAPASAMNWLAYITNHGYPEVLSGERDWQSNTNYNSVTSLINWLGTMMNTDGGTLSSNHRSGLQEWLDMTSAENFEVTLHAPSGGIYAPSPEEIYELMTAGALVTVCTTHWDYVPATQLQGAEGFELPARYVRKSGGHCVSVNRISDGCSDLPRMWFRDPAGMDVDNFSQSQFVTQYLDAEPVLAYYAASLSSAPIYRTMYRFVDDDPDRNSTIGALVAIMPTGGLSADAQQGTISVFNQHRADDFAPLPTREFNTPGNAPILGLKYLPHLGAAAVLGRAGPDAATLWRFRIGTGEFTPVATIEGPGDMAVGMAGEVYIASSAHGGGVKVCMADGSVRFVRMARGAPDALAFDDVNNRVGMIFANGHVMGTVGAIGNGAAAAPFGGDYVESPLPPNLVLGSDISMAFGSFNGGVFVASGDIDDGGIAELRLSTSGWVLSGQRLPAVSAYSMQIDPRGHVRCTVDGVARQYVRDANGARRLNPDAKFNGQRVGDMFQVSIGRAGFDDLLPPELAGIDDSAEFPSGLPECRADFNASGEVSVQDIFDFLAAYFGARPEADFNNSGNLSVQDLFDFLAAYFRSCP